MGLDGELLRHAESQSYRIIIWTVTRVPGDLYAYWSTNASMQWHRESHPPAVVSCFSSTTSWQYYLHYCHLPTFLSSTSFPTHYNLALVSSYQSHLAQIFSIIWPNWVPFLFESLSSLIFFVTFHLSAFPPFLSPFSHLFVCKVSKCCSIFRIRLGYSSLFSLSLWVISFCYIVLQTT